ncbi:uncharacterized protein PSFLO_01341 [Pseudozyma flocculosa]|uniref:Uncharacterized protein n=1 Tax=Pseudozyma flocculosa TaxID=84751 RepID=A0A5C3EVJ0_9BASI|nr:uncharacterized protein PSFLO_01341 [Pseudozyma flocculosa]
MDHKPPSSPISVPTAIVLGLVASFVQSLGLTIQRKSHLQNEALPAARRRSEWKRPLWLIGFAIFLCANVGGTVFQIGALPIVMLAPLGAVSLLYNALLARYLLNDFLSAYMIVGTALIATGAVLIGYFGVVPSTAHDLDELLELYGRPTFVAFATIFLFLFIGVLAVSHLAEWQLNARLARTTSPPAKSKSRRHLSRSRLRRRWSAPSLAPVAEVSESSSGIATPVLAVADEMARRSVILSGADIKPPPSSLAQSRQRDYGALGHGSAAAGSKGNGNGSGSAKKRGRRSSVEVPRLEAREDREPLDPESVKKTKLMLAVAYGGASGTMSGACLLLAKSGVELLMLSFSGHNQFVRWQSWMLIAVLLGAALLQLWYLNKALKLVDPTLVCPLAFCFYNTSSIALGLVYFDQLGALAWYDILAVVVGISVLLAGVWIVSLHGSSEGDGHDTEETVSLLSATSVHTASTPTERLEQAEGLLANAAGIAGPHLPFDASPSAGCHSDAASEISIDTQLSSPEAVNTQILPVSPTHSRYPSAAESPTSSPSKSPASKRRTSSSSRRRPTITLDFPLPESLFHPSSPMPSAEQRGADVERGESAAHAEGGGGGGGKPRSAFYNTIVEHGLSIGLSPSSPGFHLQPRSPSNPRMPASQSGPLYGAHGARRRPGRHPRRAMSEADASSHPAAAAAAPYTPDIEAGDATTSVAAGEEDEAGEGDDNGASSGFAPESRFALLFVFATWGSDTASCCTVFLLENGDDDDDDDDGNDGNRARSTNRPS